MEKTFDVGLLVLSALVLLLVMVNTRQSGANNAVAAELVAGQQRINEGLRLSRVNSEIVRAIAALSARSDDDDLRFLLARHGITYRIQENDESKSEPVARTSADSGASDS